MTEPILGTIPRATRVSFSRSYASFADASAIVRKGDSRFKSILDLDKAGVTIAVRAGYTDQTFAADNLPSATLRALKVDDASQVFMEVIAGKADASLADSEQVKAFAAKHPTEVEARFIDPAPSYIPAGLMYRQGDFVFGNFLDTALNYMDANAVFAHLGRKYNLPPGTLRLR
jgi:ABC-type amino acid transport substrate-binding protein